MANTAQARKRARQEITRRSHNVALASRYRTYVKAVVKQIDNGARDAAQEAFSKAIPIIDSAVNRGLVHRNKAARQKSRLNARIKAL